MKRFFGLVVALILTSQPALAQDPKTSTDVDLEAVIMDHVEKELAATIAHREKCRSNPKATACVAAREADMEELAAVMKVLGDAMPAAIPLESIIQSELQMDKQREMLQMVEDSCDNPDNPACELAMDAYKSWQKSSSP